eukprot:4397246-Amphidinium_carterae.1
MLSLKHLKRLAGGQSTSSSKHPVFVESYHMQSSLAKTPPPLPFCRHLQPRWWMRSVSLWHAASVTHLCCSPKLHAPEGELENNIGNFGLLNSQLWMLTCWEHRSRPASGKGHVIIHLSSTQQSSHQQRYEKSGTKTYPLALAASGKYSLQIKARFSMVLTQPTTNLDSLK